MIVGLRLGLHAVVGDVEVDGTDLAGALAVLRAVGIGSGQGGAATGGRPIHGNGIRVAFGDEGSTRGARRGATGESKDE